MQWQLEKLPRLCEQIESFHQIVAFINNELECYAIQCVKLSDQRKQSKSTTTVNLSNVSIGLAGAGSCPMCRSADESITMNANGKINGTHTTK